MSEIPATSTVSPEAVSQEGRRMPPLVSSFEAMICSRFREDLEKHIRPVTLKQESRALSKVGSQLTDAMRER
jgi:hypothetical protein